MGACMHAAGAWLHGDGQLACMQCCWLHPCHQAFDGLPNPMRAHPHPTPDDGQAELFFDESEVLAGLAPADRDALVAARAEAGLSITDDIDAVRAVGLVDRGYCLLLLDDWGWRA